ncbi:MAG: type VI secretion system tube protein Hcp [Akkermansiaceae bacterium]
MKTLRKFFLTVFLLPGMVLPGFAESWVKFAGVEGDGNGTPEREGWSGLKSYKDKVKATDTGVKIESVKITKCADKASVGLAVKMATGAVIPEVTLEFTRQNSDGVTEVYLIVTYCNVTITGIDTELPEGEDAKLEETVCITATEKKITDPKTGETTTLGGDP